MKLILRKPKPDVTGVNKVSVCCVCGQVFLNVDETPNHLCIEIVGHPILVPRLTPTGQSVTYEHACREGMQ